MKKIAFMTLLGLASSACAEDQVIVANSTTTPVVVEEDATTVGQHGFYYALGLLLCNSGERVDYYDENQTKQEANDSRTHLGATLALGYQFMPQNKPYCVGLEIGSDFSPRNEELHAHKFDPNKSGAQDQYYNLKTSRNGFRPFIAIRGGYVNYDHKFMAYLKAGMSYADSKEIYSESKATGSTTSPYIDGETHTVKCSSWMPIVALGVEKSFTNSFTLRSEAEYRFAKTKKKHFNSDSVKLTQKGTFNVRVLFCHNFRFGL